jgi:ankyrin repeat protein
LLLGDGAEVDNALDDTDGGVTSLYTAADSGYVELVNLLLDNGAEIDRASTDDGTTPLYVASENGWAVQVDPRLTQG